uniref:Uncharacterized protein n=1 Tax=Cacopsylla melanoneura TaxID=428564 RepID=A0A8D8PRK3_9HEMI
MSIGQFEIPLTLKNVTLFQSRYTFRTCTRNTTWRKEEKIYLTEASIGYPIREFYTLYKKDDFSHHRVIVVARRMFNRLGQDRATGAHDTPVHGKLGAGFRTDETHITRVLVLHQLVHVLRQGVAFYFVLRDL